MKQILTGITANAIQIPGPITTYGGLTGYMVANTTIGYAYSLMPTAGWLGNFTFLSDATLEAGASATITIMRDSTAMLSRTLTSADSTSFNIDGTVPFSAGNEIAYRYSTTGGTTPISITCRSYCSFNGSIDTESIILGSTISGTVNTTANRYMAPYSRSAASATESDNRQAIPTGGTFSKFYVKLSADPGTNPDTYRFTLRNNLASPASGLVVSITANTVTGNDTANSVSVVQDDLIDIMCEPVDTPSASPRVRWGMVFTPTISGEALLLGGSGNDLNVTVVEENYLGNSIGTWATNSDNAFATLLPACTISKLTVGTSSSPGAGKSYTFNLRSRPSRYYVADTSTSVIQVQISDSEIADHDNVNTFTPAVDTLACIRCTPSGTPTARDGYWGCVIIPAATSATLDSTASTTVALFGTFDSTSNLSISPVLTSDSTSSVSSIVVQSTDSTSSISTTLAALIDSTACVSVVGTATLDSTSNVSVATVRTSDSTSSSSILVSYFSPRDLSDLRLWLSADHLRGTYSDSNTVSTWPDSAGIQPPFSSAGAPLFVENAVNDLPAVRYDGNDRHASSCSGLWSATYGQTVFAVLKRAATSDPPEAIINEYNDKTLQKAEWGLNVDDYWINDDGIQSIGFSSSLTNWMFVAAKYTSGGLTTVYRDSTAWANLPGSASISVADSEVTTTWIGYNDVVTGAYLEADLAEIIIYNRDLSVEEIATVNEYLRVKYGFPEPPGTYTYDSTSSVTVVTTAAYDSTSSFSVGLIGAFDSTSSVSVSALANFDSTANASVSIYGLFDSTGNLSVSALASYDSTSSLSSILAGRLDSTASVSVYVESGRTIYYVDDVSEFASTVALMNPGDKIVIADGTYIDADNSFENLPSGSGSQNTELCAESDFGVKIYGNWCVGGVIDLFEKSYVTVQGIIVEGSGSSGDGHGIHFSKSHHIKILRCASGEVRGAGHNIGFSDSSMCLAEDCFAWGQGRYQFGTGSTGDSRDIIFRRCVARFDGAAAAYPVASFSSYDQTNVIFQNCIAIDGGGNHSGGNIEHFYRGFFTPNGFNCVTVTGCISLNIDGYGMMTEGSTEHWYGKYTDNIIWGIRQKQALASGAMSYRDDGQSIFDHFTVGDNIDTVNAFRDTVVEGSSPVTNSVFTGQRTADGRAALDRFSNTSNDYNVFYDNDDNYSSGAHVGDNDYCSENSTEINPFTNSLKYLPRIEDGSELSGTGGGGSDRGATILKKIGVSGTLYGETGWDETTSDNLWPWPYEDFIHTEFSGYDSTDRGFAVSGQTLTRYIWEYLGNSIPTEIYGYGSYDSTSNVSINLLSVSDSTSNLSVSLVARSDSTANLSSIMVSQIDSTSNVSVSLLSLIDSTTSISTNLQALFDSTANVSIRLSLENTYDSTSSVSVNVLGVLDSTSGTSVSVFGQYDSTASVSSVLISSYDSTSSVSVSVFGSYDSTSSVSVFIEGKFDSTSSLSIVVTSSYDSTASVSSALVSSYDSTVSLSASVVAIYDSTASFDAFLAGRADSTASFSVFLFGGGDSTSSLSIVIGSRQSDVIARCSIFLDPDRPLFEVFYDGLSAYVGRQSTFRSALVEKSYNVFVTYSTFSASSMVEKYGTTVDILD